MPISTSTAGSKILDGQPRRIVKSHLPLDVIPYYPEVRYIVAARDARDVFMSFWNHVSELHRDDVRPAQRSRDPARPADAALPGGHPRLLGRVDQPRLVRGGERGLSHSPNLGHTQSWWDFRHLDNILFVHFNDLLADLAGEIGRVGRYLGTPVGPAEARRLAAGLDFAAIKRNAERAAPMPPESAPAIFVGASASFFFKGTNGRGATCSARRNSPCWSRGRPG